MVPVLDVFCFLCASFSRGNMSQHVDIGRTSFVIVSTSSSMQCFCFIFPEILDADCFAINNKSTFSICFPKFIFRPVKFFYFFFSQSNFLSFCSFLFSPYYSLYSFKYLHFLQILILSIFSQKLRIKDLISCSVKWS